MALTKVNHIIKSSLVTFARLAAGAGLTVDQLAAIVPDERVIMDPEEDTIEVYRAARSADQQPAKKILKIRKNFEKTLDNLSTVCYNDNRARETNNKHTKFRRYNTMKTYQIDRLNSKGEPECTYYQTGHSRIDAYYRAEEYDEAQKKTVKTRVEGRWLIVSDPAYTSATFSVVLCGGQ